MNKNIIFAFLIFIFFYSCDKLLQNQQYNNVNTLFNNHILDSYFVTSIAFDNQGTAWIGTFKQGLIKYSSDTIEIFNSANSIISDTTIIRDIKIDSKNNVWLGCDGLIKYDGNDFTHYNSSNTPIPEDFVSSIAIDSKDNIWFSSSRFRRGGLVKFDGNNWNIYTPDNSILPVNSVNSIAVDKNSIIWLSQSETVNNTYLIRIEGDDWTLYTGDDFGFVPYYLSNIQIDSFNRVYGAIDYSLSNMVINHGPQIFMYNGKSSKVFQFDDYSDVKSITIDNRNNIWCEIFGGYAVYNGEEWFVDETIFRETGIFTIEQSNDDRIWIGTGDGIFINNDG